MKRKGLLLFLLFITTSSGCTPRQIPAAKLPLETKGEVYLYLQSLPQEAHPLTFTMHEISLVAEDGAKTILLKSGPELNGRQLIGRQKRLAAKIVEPGRYKALSLEITRASIIGEEGEIDLLVPDQPVVISQDITVLRGKATALFLALAPKEMVAAGFSFTPGFSLVRPYKQPSLIGFVSNSRANIVSVFNKRTMGIVEMISTGADPLGLALDQNRRRLYVASSSRNDITVVDVGTGDILGRIRVHFGDDPRQIILSADGGTLVSANYGSNTVSIIDTGSLTEVGRISLESEPTWLVPGSSGLQAYVLQALSNTVSIIDFSRRSLVSSIFLNETPVRGALSPDGLKLYITLQYSPDLLFIDPSSLTIAGRIYLGGRATSLAVDSKTGLVYVGKKTGEITVVDASSSMFIDNFFVEGDASFLAIDAEENCLFVLSRNGNFLHKIDLVSKKGVGRLTMEDGSYEVVIMGER